MAIADVARNPDHVFSNNKLVFPMYYNISTVDFCIMHTDASLPNPMHYETYIWVKNTSLFWSKAYALWELCIMRL